VHRLIALDVQHLLCLLPRCSAVLTPVTPFFHSINGSRSKHNKRCFRPAAKRGHRQKRHRDRTIRSRICRRGDAVVVATSGTTTTRGVVLTMTLFWHRQRQQALDSASIRNRSLVVLLAGLPCRWVVGDHKSAPHRNKAHCAEHFRPKS